MLYREEMLTLATEGGKDDMPVFNEQTFDEAADMIYKNGAFDVSQLTDPKARKLITETARILNTAVEEHISHEVSDVLRYALENNVFIFSGFKVYHSLSEVGLSLVDASGHIKPFEDFHRDVKAIKQSYYKNWLYAEYNHAVGSTLMAEKWQDLKKNSERYYLQYRTALDERVRDEHAALEGITLPADDPFWASYFPPNGWNCRCTAVKVRRAKYEMSDPDNAMRLGDKATDNVKQRIFRFNPGMEMKIFPPKHPYYKGPKAEQVKQAIDGYTPVEWTPKTVAQAEQFFRDKLGVNCALDGFTSKNMKQIEDIFRSVEEHFQRFPELKKVTLFVGSIRGRIKMLTEAKLKEYLRDTPDGDPKILEKWASSWAKSIGTCRGCYAYSHGAAKDMGLSGICFNTTWKGEKIEQSLVSEVKYKGHPVGTATLKAVFDHELGHEIDRLIGLRTHSDFLKLYNEERGKGRQYIVDNLSSYSYKNAAEFIAEAWSEYLNNEKPRPIAAAVGTLIKKMYAEKYQSSGTSPSST